MHLLTIRKLATLAGMAGLAMLILPAWTRADISITYQEISPTALGPFTQLNPGSPAGIGLTVGSISPQTFGDFTVNSYAIRERDATGIVPTNLNAIGMSVSNNSMSTATLVITIVATGYNTPPAGPAVMFNSLNTNTLTPSPTNAISFTSTIGGTTSGVLSSNLNILGTQQAPAGSGSQATGVTIPNTPTFSITESFSLTLISGGVVDVTALTSVTATPEPATVAMALTALPLLGIGAYVRRRRAKA